MSSQTKRTKKVVEELKLCALCLTKECEESEHSSGLPSKETIGEQFNSLPNEVIYLILRKISLNDLSNTSLTNKWFRDFIVQHFFESKTGLPSLLGSYYESTNAKTSTQQRLRLDLFFKLGLLLKRTTCLYPTEQRIEILVKVLHRLDGIPKISLNPVDNQTMRYVFQSYGHLIRHFVNGWDDCELKLVFKTLQSIPLLIKTSLKDLISVTDITKMDENIKIIDKKPFGVSNAIEYYIRSFYRMVCIEPNRRSDKGTDDDNRLFWLKSILKKRSLPLKARLLQIIFGPLISQSPIPTSIPYIGYWDLTDTFFIDSGLEELGDAIRMLYINANTDEQRNSVLSVMTTIMKIPTNWLSENVASLLFYAGDEVTYDYLSSHLNMNDVSEVAQNLVFLTLVSYKLTKETKSVYNLIEELATTEHRINLYNEVKVAFCEAVSEMENAFELEDERDVCEIHEMIEANNDLLMNYMIRPSPHSSQESPNSESPKEVKPIPVETTEE